MAPGGEGKKTRQKTCCGREPDIIIISHNKMQSGV